MKKICVILVLLNLSLGGYCQEFTLKFSEVLPDTLTYNKVEWMDADNDGFLDALVFATNVGGDGTISFFKNDSLNGFGFSHFIDTEISSAAFYLTDYDGDSRVDVIVSGERAGQEVTMAFLNKGNFLFQSVQLLSMSADVIRMADLDGDGFREMLLSGKNVGSGFVYILKHYEAGWTSVHDSIQVFAHAIEVFDFDADNDLDFFVAGTEDGVPVNRFFSNEKGFFFAAHDFVSPVLGSTAITDLNEDGNFDIILAGVSEDNTPTLRTFTNTSAGFTVNDSLVVLSNTEIFAADFDSDGLYDLNIFGFSASGDTLNSINGAGRVDTLQHSGLRLQRFGDFERDGDLDVLQLIKKPSGYSLAVLENTTPAKNSPPGPPTRAVTFYLFNRLFIGWEKPTDDHTATRSLTYDISLQIADRDVTSGEFDLASARKLLVQQGNAGTAHYRLMRVKDKHPFGFSILAIDNAFHSGNGSRCIGTGGGAPPLSCDDQFTFTPLEACRNELVTLASDLFAEWYSFNDGFLAATDTLSFNVAAGDTIFSVGRLASGCVKVDVYTIDTPTNLVKTTESTMYVCEAQKLFLGTEAGWATREWRSAVNGFLSAEDSIEYLVTVPDTIVMAASNGMGCEIRRKTILRISKPVPVVADEGFQIRKGETVSLNASGGVSYEWTPSTGLSDPQSPNPIASPFKTTNYTVTVKDSIGCSATATIIVMVVETAFIPNLFTPNYDGSNDVLKIYSLGEVKDFSFSIYNREGSRVYFTNNPSEAVNAGWDGATSGVEQPAGLYHWTVNGQTVNGMKLQLNGKDSGAIILVR